MSELHKFLFDGLPVRGMVVRLTDAWTELLARRAGNTETGPYPVPVSELLGEMAAAAVLMQSNIKFNGALVLQIFGDGPVKLAVAEVQSDLSLRATASVTGELPADARLPDMVNVGGGGRCAITLDPKDRLPGQQPYQGVVPLHGDHKEKLTRLSDVLQHYMLQSEQLDTTLVLAANDQVAAGLLIQRMPLKGEGNLAGAAGQADEAVLVRLALVAPGMRTHLQRDLGGRGAVAAVEGMAQAGERTQPLGQLHHRRMGEAGQHDVIEPAELVDQRLAQRRVVVAEQVDPPGADAVEDAPPLGVMQPDALGAHHRHQRQAGAAAGLALVQLHLGAGMPHRAQAAGAPVVVQAHVGRSFFSAAARSAPGSPDASAVPSPGSSRP